MSRFEDSLNDGAAGDSHVPYVLFADFDFDSGNVRLSSWDRPYSFGGNTFTAGGTLVDIGDVTESNTLNSEKLDFVLSGVSESLMTSALAENYVGRSVTLYLGFADVETYELVATPEILWEGIMDVMSVRFSNTGENSIVVTAENRLLFWNDSIGLSYSDEHQKAGIDSSDNFFDQVSTLANKNVLWGSYRVGIGTNVGRIANQIIGGFMKKMGFGFI